MAHSGCFTEAELCTPLDVPQRQNSTPLDVPQRQNSVDPWMSHRGRTLHIPRCPTEAALCTPLDVLEAELCTLLDVPQRQNSAHPWMSHRDRPFHCDVRLLTDVTMVHHYHLTTTDQSNVISPVHFI